MKRIKNKRDGSIRYLKDYTLGSGGYISLEGKPHEFFKHRDSSVYINDKYIFLEGETQSFNPCRELPLEVGLKEWAHSGLRGKTYTNKKLLLL